MLHPRLMELNGIMFVVLKKMIVKFKLSISVQKHCLGYIV